MATLPELESALIKADAAGNTEDAKVLAQEIRRLRGGSGGTTSGGIMGEAGKGVVRGASDAALAASKGVLGPLLGPVGGGLAQAGVERLAAPSREPFRATPQGTAEKVAGIGGEVVGGFIAPSLPSLAMKGAGLVKKVVGPATKTIRNLVDPLLPGGTERAVGRTLLKLAGEKRAKVMAALAEPSEIVPKSIPTGPEAAARAGSAEFSGAQRLAEQRLPTAYQDINVAQEGARQGAIQSFGQTPKQLEAAIAARAAEAKSLYEKASQQVLRVDDELKELLKSDSMRKAMERVKSIETEVGKARPSPEGTMSVGRLHYLKMAMDDFVKDPDRFGISGLETAAYQGTRSALVKWITGRSPDYEKARQAFAKISGEIDVMKVGQGLGKDLRSPLGTSERAAVFARSMEEQPRTIKKATGSPRFNTLEEAVGKENTALAQAVLDDLVRSDQHKILARAGAGRAGEIIGEAVPGLPATGPLHQKYMIFKTIFNRFGGKLGDAEMKVLAETLKTPEATLKLMQKAAAREAFIEGVTQQIPQRLSFGQRVGAGGAGAAAALLQEGNQ